MLTEKDRPDHDQASTSVGAFVVSRLRGCGRIEGERQGAAGNLRSGTPTEDAMAKAMRVCSCTGCPAHAGSCPELVKTRRCDRCAPQYERARGTRQQRGYGAEHDELRARWKPKVEACTVHCHAKVCVMPARLILPGQAWDLGHTEDRKGWTGPEHARCNRAAGGRAAHGRS